MSLVTTCVDYLLAYALERCGVPTQIIGAELSPPLMIRYHLCFAEWTRAFPYLHLERCQDSKDRKRQKIVLHRTMRADVRDKGVHSHPWRFWSIVLFGWYRETYVVWRGSQPSYSGAQHLFVMLTRTRGFLSSATHEATYEHLIEAVGDSPCWTLAILGPVTNAWGFPFVGETVRDANGEKVTS